MVHCLLWEARNYLGVFRLLQKLGGFKNTKNINIFFLFFLAFLTKVYVKPNCIAIYGSKCQGNKGALFMS